MTKDDRNNAGPDSRGSASGASESATGSDPTDDRLEAAETRVLDADEVAAAETLVVGDERTVAVSDPDDRTELAEVADAEDPTVLVSPSDETVVVEQAPAVDEAEASAKETRVLDPTIASSARVAPGGMAGAATASGLAETRVLDENDKTSPPPVDSGRASAAPRPSSPIDSERGLPPGMILFGEYEIVNVLGVGGMGEVYRAKHRRLEEHRAIKVMHAELATKKGASEFFYREAKALLAVRHPAVVHCHDLLSDDEGRVYLIMEMIEGIPLSKKMNDGPLSTDEVAILGARVAHGLTAAHRKGVIHRDLSPDNIVLPNGRVQEAKIIDFGIAKLLQDGEGTILDGFKGKLSYASPEQLGFFGGKIDGRSDFYSLGLVLVAAALGRPMEMGTTVVEAVDARRAFQKLPDAIPIGLRSAIQPLLALDPKDRPEYVDRLFVGPGGLESLGEAGIGSEGGIRRRSDGVSPARSGASNRVGMIAGLAGSAALVLGGGAYLALSGGASESDGGARNGVVAEAKPGASGQPIVAGEVVPPGTSNAAAEKSPSATAVAEPPVVVAKVPKVRRPSASERMKIIGLISNAKLALSEDRLMSPADDNAYDRYRQVLEYDPTDKRAKRGLREIASRYVSLANAALGRADLDRARTFVERARRADPEHPELPSVEGRIQR